MLRRRSIERGLGVMAVAASLAATACTDDGVALHIECNVAPDVTDTSCTWNPDGKDCVFDGRMNLRAAQSYYAGFRVRSGLKARSRTSPPRSEPNGIQLQEVEVELRAPGGRPIGFPKLANPYTLVSSGYVQPSGVGLLQVELIPAAYAQVLRDLESDPDTQLGQVVAVVKAKGITDGQTKVETANFFWPIRLTYVSPVAGVKGQECIESESGVCGTLRGLDGFADVCLCDGTDDSCDLEEK